MVVGLANKKLRKKIHNGISEIGKGDFARINFEIQDRGEFLLIQVNLSKLISHEQLESYRNKVGQVIFDIFDSYGLKNNWMVVFLLDGEVIDSVYSDLLGNSDFT